MPCPHPDDPAWDDVSCPCCSGEGRKVTYSYEDDDPIKRKIIKTYRDCELCDGSGVVSPFTFNEYRRDPLGTLARR